jgi:superfamily II RNA helicase
LTEPNVTPPSLSLSSAEAALSDSLLSQPEAPQIREASPRVDAFQNRLQFPLDDFQYEAMAHIANEHSVVVCAPTGAGKTVIAEFAAHETLEKGGKLFYTSPLKALSNQKYLDLKAQFGEDNVGLLTGDMSVNRDARIVVMTTEVFRNMLYGLNEDKGLLDNLRYVVLDECHFMNDADRGTVWEESIIYCPPSVKLIALSATVANAQELTQWIDQIHPTTHLVYSTFRPVPLRYFYYGRKKLLPLFEGTSKKFNKKIHQLGRPNPKGKGSGGPSLVGEGLRQLVFALAEQEMLPGIVFTFSRKGCERSLKDCIDIPLLDRNEQTQVQTLIAQFEEQSALVLQDYQREALLNGIASHHAGLLPAHKLLVETLFQKGLLRVVFATETLAAGINMPARSTIISSISKRSDDGHRTLTASEFLQMSGRAGRRGMDTIGYVVVVSSPFDSPEEMARLASSPPDPLNSRFTPSYGMVLNLLQTVSLQEASYLVNKSFGAFTSDRRTKPLNTELLSRQERLQEAAEFHCPADWTDDQFVAHLDLRWEISNINRQISRYERQFKKGVPSDLAANHPLHKLYADKAERVAVIETSPCVTCDLFKQHRRNLERNDRLNRQIERLEQEVEVERNIYWHRFMGLSKLLQAMNYLDDDFSPTPQGIVASQLRTENELYISELLFAQVFEELEPHQMAGLVSALVNDSNRDNVYTYLRYSQPVGRALRASDRVKQRVERIQKDWLVDIPCNLNSTNSSLAEAWAKGMSWEGLINSGQVEGGDLVRNFRRTMDVLRQISYIKELPMEVSRAAFQAVLAMNQEPVKEVELIQPDADFKESS